MADTTPEQVPTERANQHAGLPTRTQLTHSKPRA